MPMRSSAARHGKGGTASSAGTEGLSFMASKKLIKCRSRAASPVNISNRLHRLVGQRRIPADVSPFMRSVWSCKAFSDARLRSSEGRSQAAVTNAAPRSSFPKRWQEPFRVTSRDAGIAGTRRVHGRSGRGSVEFWRCVVRQNSFHTKRT